MSRLVEDVEITTRRMTFIVLVMPKISKKKLERKVTPAPNIDSAIGNVNKEPGSG